MPSWSVWLVITVKHSQNILIVAVYLNPVLLPHISSYFPLPLCHHPSTSSYPSISNTSLRHFAFQRYFCPSLPSLFPSLTIVTMESQDQINTLEGGLRHLRMRDSDELVKYAIPTENVPRPGFNTTGKEIEVAVNAYGITKYPNRTVYQYDVSSWASSLTLIMSMAC